MKCLSTDELFFVRDFAGDRDRIDRQGFGAAPQDVTSHPGDTGSNNLRVFVVPGATRQVRFLSHNSPGLLPIRRFLTGASRLRGPAGP